MGLVLIGQMRVDLLLGPASDKTNSTFPFLASVLVLLIGTMATFEGLMISNSFLNTFYVCLLLLFCTAVSSSVFRMLSMSPCRKR